jgi:hypothetical protein
MKHLCHMMVKRSEREADHSSPPNVELTNAPNCISALPRAFMACAGPTSLYFYNKPEFTRQWTRASSCSRGRVLYAVAPEGGDPDIRLHDELSVCSAQCMPSFHLPIYCMHLPLMLHEGDALSEAGELGDHLTALGTNNKFLCFPAVTTHCGCIFTAQ